MAKEYDILKKLVKGLNQQPSNKGSKEKNSESEHDVKAGLETTIPLRSLETILNETNNQEKKE
jgi:hypothetical protein